MRPKVLVTRAEPGASRTAARLEALGFEPVLAPTSTIEPLQVAIELNPGESLALTSPNGAMAAGRLLSTREPNVFAVGDATADTARAIGFTQVTSAQGDGAGLASAIAEAGVDSILHIRGRDQAFDLVSALSTQGIKARSVIAYIAQPAPALPDTALEALDQGALVLIHSAKGGERFVTLCPSSAALHRYAVISEAAATPLRAAGATRLSVSERPDETALLKAVEIALS